MLSGESSEQTFLLEAAVSTMPRFGPFVLVSAVRSPSCLCAALAALPCVALSTAPLQAQTTSSNAHGETARRSLPAEPPRDVLPRSSAPEGFRLERTKRNTAIVVGSVVLGVGYALSLTGLPAADKHPSAAWLAVPVLGPWIALGTYREPERRCSSSELGCIDIDVGPDTRAVLGVLGMVQTVGAVVLGVGLATPKERLVRKDTAITTWKPALGVAGSGVRASIEGAF